MLSEQDEGAEGFHAFNPNQWGGDGKRSEKLRGMLKKAVLRDYMAEKYRCLLIFAQYF